MSKTLGVTGRRPQYFPWRYTESDPRCVVLKSLMEQHIRKSVNDGFDRFVSGMALGVDMMFAEIVLKVRDEGYDIKLVAEVPFPDQPSRWPSGTQERYQNILDRADEVNVTSDAYSQDAFFERNGRIVDQSDEILAVWEGWESGGTFDTVQRAGESGKRVTVIDYRTLGY